MEAPNLTDTNEERREKIEKVFRVKLSPYSWIYHEPHRFLLEVYTTSADENNVEISIENQTAIWRMNTTLSMNQKYKIKLVTDNNHPQIFPRVFISPQPSFLPTNRIKNDGSINFNIGHHDMIINILQRVQHSLHAGEIVNY